ncbi:MAG: hypothetical protein WA174_06525 [Rhodoferax sp.]
MFQVHDKVMVTPKGAQWREFFAFVDGWRGEVTGWNNGFVMVVCQQQEGPKTLFVPPDCLTLTV